MSKSQNFPTARVFYASAEGAWNWVSALGVKKTKTMGLPGRQRILMISSAVWIQCTNVTDGQRDTRWQQRPRLRIVSHGNKTGMIIHHRDGKFYNL